MIFPIGEPNTAYAQYFIGNSYLAQISDSQIPFANVTFEPINTGLTEQFIIHIKTAICVGVLCALPYIIYQLFRFVSPALYAEEQKYAIRVVTGGYVMFLLGVLLTYHSLLVWKIICNFESFPKVK